MINAELAIQTHRATAHFLHFNCSLMLLLALQCGFPPLFPLPTGLYRIPKSHLRKRRGEFPSRQNCLWEERRFFAIWAYRIEEFSTTGTFSGWFNPIFYFISP